ncbi:MAG: tyrosine-protein phosphatase [Clostridiales bacterium]|nr:tyrosine-protein phosphatase [Clostridiales bacterium]
MLRRIPFEHLKNLRDLGGFPAGKTHVTRWGICYRSNLPENLTEEEKQWLLAQGVTTIIDLRNAGERQRRPNCLEPDPRFRYCNFSMYEDGASVNMGDPEGKQQVGKFYLDMLGSTPAPVQALRSILNAPGGVLFHCSAGKDRTGLIGALLLLLAGVADDDIIADYQVSYTYMRDYALAMAEVNPDRPAYIYHSDPDFMRDFLAAFRARYGTVEAYLKANGFEDRDVETLREKLREPM